MGGASNLASRRNLHGILPWSCGPAVRPVTNEVSFTRVSERLAALAPFAPFLHVARRVERLLSVAGCPF